jgi:DNA invertase Pin-like site-specific DNA recombinase
MAPSSPSSAEFERDLSRGRTLLRKRTRTGLRFARARRRSGGSKWRVTPERVQQAAQLMQTPNVSVQQICQQLAIFRATLYRYVSPTGEVCKE